MIDLLKKHSFFQGKQIESCELLANQGYCNENYLLVVDGVKYIVRFFNKDDTNREEEFHLQKEAYLLDIAPQPLVLNLKDGYMVMEFIEGVHQKKLDVFSLYMLVDAVSLLHDNVFLEQNMVKVKDLIKSRNQEIEEAIKMIEWVGDDPVVCHNDLNPMNILWQGNKPVLLDFEYACVNDSYFDLAALSIEFKLEIKEESLMLRRYFGGIFFREKFDAYKVIYKAVCTEWFEANS